MRFLFLHCKFNAFSFFPIILFSAKCNIFFSSYFFLFALFQTCFCSQTLTRFFFVLPCTQSLKINKNNFCTEKKIYCGINRQKVRNAIEMNQTRELVKLSKFHGKTGKIIKKKIKTHENFWILLNYLIKCLPNVGI